MTGWERWSTGNCARNWNFTILTNDICTNQKLSLKMKHMKFSVTLKYKWIIQSRPVLINKKERTCHLADFVVPADYTMKVIEDKYRYKYLDLARELKRLEIRRIETILTTGQLKSTWILRRVQETWGDLLSLRYLWKPSNKADVKNSHNNNNNNNNDGDSDINSRWNPRNNSKEFRKEFGGTEDSWKDWNLPDYNSIEISKNTEKSPREQKKLAITCTPANTGVKVK